jgi:molecular chaperone DnaK
MADKVNAADSMIFPAEKQLKEYGDKIPSDKKGRIENALGQLREAHKNKISPVLTVLLQKSNAAGRQHRRDMYKQAQGDPDQQAGSNPELMQVPPAETAEVKAATNRSPM